MFIARVFASILALCLASISEEASSAETLGGPATGLWAHPGDGGRGFNIDIQDGTMIVTTFIYTQSGDPIWYLSSGIYNHTTGVFTSSYDSYSNGQCFGCPATPPVAHSGAAGPMTIHFHDNTTATLTTPSGSLEIRKFDYGFANETARLYGYWVFTFDVIGLVSGDFVIFNDTYTDSSGNVYAAGHSDDASQRPALGRYVPQLDAFVVATQSSTSFTHSYKLKLDDHRAFGFAWVVPNGQSPTGNGAPAFAGRLLFRTELSNLTAKRDSVDATVKEDSDRALSKQSESSTVATLADPNLAEINAALTAYAETKR